MKNQTKTKDYGWQIILVLAIAWFLCNSATSTMHRNTYVSPAQVPVSTRDPNDPCAGLRDPDMITDCQAEQHRQEEWDYYNYLAEKAEEDIRRERAEEVLLEIAIARGERIYAFDKARLARTGDICRCDGNYYNCADFPYQSEAQSCYDSCVSAGSGDIHWLDDDGDGRACESLP